MATTGFETRFEEIQPGCPEFGEAALLPWDIAIFGFAVAAFRVPRSGLGISPGIAATRQCFHSWMQRHSIAVCACSIEAVNEVWKALLPELGFRFVDFSLQARFRSLASARLPPAPILLRPAEPRDAPRIEDIASRAFCHGRYFADVHFPKDLARLRYRRWVANALASKGDDRVYVTEENGDVDGFFHLLIDGEAADLRLAAVAPELRKTGLGFHLYAAMLQQLKDRGVRRVRASISAANTEVMSIYAALGFYFDRPELIYHWRPGNGVLPG